MSETKTNCYHPGCENLDCHECQDRNTQHRIPFKNAYDNDVKMISFDTDTYLRSGGLSVQMFYWDSDACVDLPFASLTVNLKQTKPGTYAFVDTNNLGEEILDWLAENGIGEYTGRTATSGMCIYPEVRFDMQKIKEHSMCQVVKEPDNNTDNPSGTDKTKEYILELIDALLALAESIKIMDLYHYLPHDDINRTTELIRKIKEEIS